MSTPLLGLTHDTAHPLNNTIAVCKLIKKEQQNCQHILDNYYTQ